jgi:hypothetical protein
MNRYSIYINSSRGGKFEAGWAEDLLPEGLQEVIKKNVDIDFPVELLSEIKSMHFAGAIVMSMEDGSGPYDIDLEKLNSGNWKVRVSYDQSNHDDIQLRMIVASDKIRAALRRMIPYCMKFREDITSGL